MGTPEETLEETPALLHTGTYDEIYSQFDIPKRNRSPENFFLEKHEDGYYPIPRWLNIDTGCGVEPYELRENGVVVSPYAEIDETADLDHAHGTIIKGLARVGMRSTIGKFSEIGLGAQVGDDSHIGVSVYLGNYSRVGQGSVLSHSIQVGQHVSIKDNVDVAGFSDIGDETTISEDVQIGMNAQIGTNVFVEAKARIGQNVTIGDWGVVGKTRVGDHSVFEPETSYTKRRLGPYSRVVRWTGKLVNSESNNRRQRSTEVKTEL